MSDTYVATGTNEFLEKQAMVDAESTGEAQFAGVGPPSDWESTGSDADMYATWNEISTYFETSGSEPTGSVLATKAEFETYRVLRPAEPTNFSAFQDLGACPGSAVDLSWTAHAGSATVIDHRKSTTGSWTQIATPAAGVGTFYHTTQGVGADKTATNYYRIRWSDAATYSTDNAGPWVCPS